MMNWDYLAGLFDGEGHFGIRLREKTEGIQFHWGITGSSDVMVGELVEFLSEKNIHAAPYMVHSKLGSAWHVQVTKMESVRTIIVRLLPRVIEKRRHCEVMRDAIEFWTFRNKTSRHKNLVRMDQYRHKLHALRKKGPKTLKKWRLGRLIRKLNADSLQRSQEK